MNAASRVVDGKTVCAYCGRAWRSNESCLKGECESNLLRSRSSPKTEGATPINIPGASHNCIERKCSIQTCEEMEAYLIAQGRIVKVGEGQYQSDIAYGFDKIDPLVLFEVAAILEAGAKTYGIDAWHTRTARHHLNHAIAHLYSILKDDPNDDENHFGNAACRVIFCYGVFLRTGRLDTPARSIDNELEAENSLH